MVAPNHQPPDKLDAFLAELLADQQQLQTPVARASAIMDVQPEAFRGDRFRDLIPLSAPKPGEQYAFEVDLDACSGCKACVAGCHSLNGLDEEETWRDVGVVLAASSPSSISHLPSSISPPYQQTITTACHHCADPGCLNGCPVLAYEKDPVTGIVRHLDDQCIGCSYCVLKCPYDVPKYNERLGIVRKCDMCHQRLGAGEAPACVQACPTHAIRILTVPLESDPRATDTSRFLSAAPDPATTRPTTRYISERETPAQTIAADAGVARVQPAHTPLAVLLVLTQLALGLQLAGLFVTYCVTNSPGIRAGGGAQFLLGAAAVIAAAGLAASVAHLGQPLRAWRIFLGLRRSWLSREAVVMGVWFGALTAAAVTGSERLAVAAVALGVAGVACSAMIYIDTRRKGWSGVGVAAKFAGTVTLGAGLALGPVAALAAVALKLLAERFSLARGPWQTRALRTGALRFAFRLQRLLAATGLFLLAAAAGGETGAWPVAAAFLVAGEIAERILFFRAIDESAMPGPGSP